MLFASKTKPKYTRNKCIVQINANMLPYTTIFNLTNQHTRNRELNGYELAQEWAFKFDEVIVDGFIPPWAIVNIFPG